MSSRSSFQPRGDVRLLQAHAAQQDEQRERQHVHQAIPVQRDRADRQGDGIGIGCISIAQLIS
jgi:hypothetical protein